MSNKPSQGEALCPNTQRACFSEALKFPYINLLFDHSLEFSFGFVICLPLFLNTGQLSLMSYRHSEVARKWSSPITHLATKQKEFVHDWPIKVLGRYKPFCGDSN